MYFSNAFDTTDETPAATQAGLQQRLQDLRVVGN